MIIHFGHGVGKYDPYYWITQWLSCRDRPAAARHCACYLSWFVLLSFFTALRTLGLFYCIYYKCIYFKFPQCKPEYKVPGLYVIDSICRQSRHQFGPDKDVFSPRFTKNIVNTFTFLYKCPPDERVSCFFLKPSPDSFGSCSCVESVKAHHDKQFVVITFLSPFLAPPLNY